MAGTAVTYSKRDDIHTHRASPGLMKEIGDDLTAIMVDIEVLRTGLALAEDFILEVNADMETRIAVSESYAPSNLADAAGETTTQLTATGAVLGDFVQVSFSLDLEDFQLTGYVDSTASVEAWLQNESGAQPTLSSGTISYLVTPFATSALSGTVTASVLSASAFDAAGDMTGYDITIS